MCRAAGNLSEGNSAGGVLWSVRRGETRRESPGLAFPSACVSTVEPDSHAVPEPAAASPVCSILVAARTSRIPQPGRAIEQRLIRSKDESRCVHLKQLTQSGGILFVIYGRRVWLRVPSARTVLSSSSTECPTVCSPPEPGKHTSAHCNTQIIHLLKK